MSQKLLINQNSMPALLTTDCSSIFNNKVFSQRMQTHAHGRLYRETTLTHEKLKPEQFGHSIPEYDGLFCI
jgi:hypothetical protein